MQPRGNILRRIIHGAGLLAAVFGMALAASAAPSLGTAKKSGQSTAREVEELHKAKHLLERADHDYKGHRVKAIEDIDKAIHALHHHNGQQKSQAGTTGESGGKKGTSKTSTASKTPSSGGKEPQAESDRQLREAIHILREVEKQLHAHHQSKGGGQQGGQHSKAATDVKQAIHELEVALSIK